MAQSREQIGDEALHPAVDLVADPPHRLEILAGGIVQLPVLVPLARIDRAGVAAAHRDHDVRGLHELVGQRLRELLAHVHADLLHRLVHDRVDLVAGRAPGRPHVNAALGAELDQPGRHLAPSGVVDADEQDLGLLLHDRSFHLCQRPEPLAREAVGEDGNEDVDPGLSEEVERLRDVALDRLLGEDALELVGEPLGCLMDVMLGDRIERLRHLRPPSAAAGTLGRLDRAAGSWSPAAVTWSP